MFEENILSIVLKGKDETGAATRSAKNNIQGLGDQIRKTNSELGSMMDKWRNSNGAMEQSLGALKGVFTSVFGGLIGLLRNVASGVLNLASSILSSLVAAFQELLSVATKVGLVIGGVLAAGLIAIGKAGVDMNVTLEGAQQAFVRLTGSAGGAAQLIADLRKEAMQSALTFKEMLPIAQSLAAVYGPQGIGRVIPTMRAFADTATALRVDSAGLERSLLGFRQLISRPTASAEDLNQVLENLPGANIRGWLAQKFGTADTEVLGKAGVTGEQVGQAILEGMQKTFGGSQAALGGTLPVLFSNFTDAWNDFTAAITQRFTPILTAATAKVLAMFQALASNQKIVSGISSLFEVFGSILTNVINLIPGFVTWLEEVLSRQNILDFLGKLVDWFNVLKVGVETFLDTIMGKNRAFGVDWESVWNNIKAVTTGTIKLVGGTLSGIVNVFREMLDAQKETQQGWMSMAEALRQFAIVGVSAMARFTIAIGAAVTAYGLLAAAIGLATKNPEMVLKGGVAAAGGVFLAQGAVSVGGQLVAGLKGLDTSKIGQWMGGMVGQQGPLGGFARGYAQFGTAFDAALAGQMPGAQAVQGMIPGAGGPTGAPRGGPSAYGIPPPGAPVGSIGGGNAPWWSGLPPVGNMVGPDGPWFGGPGSPILGSTPLAFATPNAVAAPGPATQAAMRLAPQGGQTPGMIQLLGGSIPFGASEAAAPVMASSPIAAGGGSVQGGNIVLQFVLPLESAPGRLGAFVEEKVNAVIRQVFPGGTGR